MVIAAAIGGNDLFNCVRNLRTKGYANIGIDGNDLSIVKHGVTFLGGTLKMLSEVGKGTEITMTFPKERKTNL